MFGIDVPALAARLGADNLWKTVQSFTQGLVVPKTAGMGIKVDTAAPTFGWADMLGEITPRAAGVTVPTFAAYRGTIYQYRFDTAGTSEVFNNFHVTHDYVPGTDVYVHPHWSVASAPTGSVNWLFDVVYAKGYSQEVFEGTVGSAAPVTLSLVDTPTTAYQHRIPEILMATPGGLLISDVNVSITSGAAILTAASAAFASSDIGRTIRVIGAGAAGGNLDTTVSAYTSATQVTLTANAGTTVVSQPNLRWRIIDANRLEPDGVIVVRTWNQPNRAADTLNTNPWLHFVDCHYQTTGVAGTKQRNGPAFYT